MKTCTLCGLTKPLSEYSYTSNSRSPDKERYRHARCKSCHSKIHIAYRKKMQEQVDKEVRLYKRKHKL